MNTCWQCGEPYGRTYEQHSGSSRHRAAIYDLTRGDRRPLNCCGSNAGHLPTCETVRTPEPLEQD